MREVVVYELLSLDGVAESPDRFFDRDDALDANLAVVGRQDAVILGRRSYEGWPAPVTSGRNGALPRGGEARGACPTPIRCPRGGEIAARGRSRVGRGRLTCPAGPLL